MHLQSMGNAVCVKRKTPLAPARIALTTNSLLSFSAKSTVATLGYETRNQRNKVRSGRLFPAASNTSTVCVCKNACTADVSRSTVSLQIPASLAMRVPKAAIGSALNPQLKPEPLAFRTRHYRPDVEQNEDFSYLIMPIKGGAGCRHGHNALVTNHSLNSHFRRSTRGHKIL